MARSIYAQQNLHLSFSSWRMLTWPLISGLERPINFVSMLKFSLDVKKPVVQGTMVRAYQLIRILSVREELLSKSDLLRTLVRRDLESRYKGSIIGNLWPLLNQIAQLLIYTYVFSVILKVKLNISDVGGNEKLTFGLWLFAGLLPWTAFSGGFSQAATSVISQPNLVKKVVFPLALLPLVPVFSAFVESAIGITVLIVMVALSSGKLEPTLALFPVVWVVQLLLTAGLGYWAAGLTVFLRDVPQTLGVLLNILMYATPVIYPAYAIPEAWRQWVFYLNPLTAIVETYRDIVLVGKIQHGPELAVSGTIALFLLITGLWFYQRLRKSFADVI
jgi:lipopolysaccharide transport system permease protein